MGMSHALGLFQNVNSKGDGVTGNLRDDLSGPRPILQVGKLRLDVYLVLGHMVEEGPQ